jgi:hypothetical protein
VTGCERTREQLVDQHRVQAATRERQAEVAEQRARVAAQEAERERAESQVAEEKPKLHERGLTKHRKLDLAQSYSSAAAVCND